MATGDRVQIADKPTLDAVKNRIGVTSDDEGGASVTTGTLMAKLNKVLTELANVTQQTNEVISILKPLIEEDIRGNTTELVVPTTFTDGVEIAKNTQDSTVTHDINNVIINQTDNAVYKITFQGTSPYTANKSASIALQIKNEDSSGEVLSSGPLYTMPFGNNTKLDEQGKQQLYCYVTAVNITRIRFKLTAQANRYISLDWYKIERLR